MADYIPADCTLFPYRDKPGRCDHCGNSLTGRQTRWCSPECAGVFQINHYWQFARPAAVKRDGNRCVKCGAKPVLKSWSDPDVVEIRLEVNHIVPREGQGYNAGCHHHLGNLETLCRPCHVVVTTDQIRDRKEMVELSPRGQP